MPISGHSAGERATAREVSGTAGSGWQEEVSARVRECRDRIDAARSVGGHAHEVRLIAVTKTHGIEAVAAAAAAGVRDVGENRVQEAEPKMAQSTWPLKWHLIGHLQRNKARAAVAFDMVHSLDSERLAVALDREARAASGTLDVLVQVNISGEDTKSGLSAAELPQFGERLHAFSSLRVCGVMTMAPLGAEERVLRRVFGGARTACHQLQSAGHPATVLSMGMSGDFEIAVEEGATHVRLGTILFGGRL